MLSYKNNYRKVNPKNKEQNTAALAESLFIKTIYLQKKLNFHKHEIRINNGIGKRRNDL